jgi:hypothetical protein
METRLPPDFKEFLRLLNLANVEYLVVGEPLTLRRLADEALAHSCKCGKYTGVLKGL